MSADKHPTIIYTLTDEAPLLATYAFLPIVRTFAGAAGIEVESKRHFGGRRGSWPSSPTGSPEQRVPDNLAELGG